MKPILSILVPVYNRPEWLAVLLDSYYEQASDEVELILSDDNSPRASEIRLILDNFKYQNISKYYQKSNLGEVGNKNFLLSKALGKYVLYIGDDDELAPDSLSKLLEIIKKTHHPLYLMGYEMINEVNSVHCTNISPTSYQINQQNQRTYKLVFQNETLPMWHFHPATYCVRKDIAKNYMFSSSVGMAEDMWFIFEYLLDGNSAEVIPLLFFKWRKFDTYGQSNQSAQIFSNLIARILIFNQIANSPRYTEALNMRLEEFYGCFILPTLARDCENNDKSEVLKIVDYYSQIPVKISLFKLASNYPKLFLIFYDVRRLIRFLSCFGLKLSINEIIKRMRK